MRNLLIRSAILVTLLQSTAVSEGIGRFGEFQKNSSVARKLWHSIYDAPIVDRTHTTDKYAIQYLAEIYLQLDAILSTNLYQNEIFDFLKVLATSVLKQEASERSDCFRNMQSVIMSMEQLQMASAQTYTPDKYTVFYTQKASSTIMPLSGWQGYSEYLINGHGNRVTDTPYIQHGKPTNLGNTFQELGCYDKAWKVLCEDNYLFNQDYVFFEKRYKPALLHAHYWYSAAECAYRAGKRDLAWGFLMKAAVFGNEQLYEQTIETAKLWHNVEAGTAELPQPEPLTPEERKEKFKEIVMAYKNMNAHPRAWAVIDEYKHEFDDPEGLKKEIQYDWLDLTNRLCNPSIARRVILYGYELLRVEVAEDGTRTEIRPFQPLDVKIPWIYPEGWKETAQKMLDEEMEKLGVSNDRFRTWHTQGGAVSIEAKFISWIDDRVTLEKQDAATLTIALKELMAGDQNFIRHCFVRTTSVPESQP